MDEQQQQQPQQQQQQPRSAPGSNPFAAASTPPPPHATSSPPAAPALTYEEAWAAASVQLARSAFSPASPQQGGSSGSAVVSSAACSSAARSLSLSLSGAGVMHRSASIARLPSVHELSAAAVRNLAVSSNGGGAHPWDPELGTAPPPTASMLTRSPSVSSAGSFARSSSGALQRTPSGTHFYSPASKSDAGGGSIAGSAASTPLKGTKDTFTSATTPSRSGSAPLKAQKLAMLRSLSAARRQQGSYYIPYVAAFLAVSLVCAAYLSVAGLSRDDSWQGPVGSGAMVWQLLGGLLKFGDYTVDSDAGWNTTEMVAAWRSDMVLPHAGWHKLGHPKTTAQHHTKLLKPLHYGSNDEHEDDPNYDDEGGEDESDVISITTTGQSVKVGIVHRDRTGEAVGPAAGDAGAQSAAVDVAAEGPAEMEDVAAVATDYGQGSEEEGEPYQAQGRSDAEDVVEGLADATADGNLDNPVAQSVADDADQDAPEDNPEG